MAQMRSDGWSHATHYDAGSKRHDATEPFDELSEDDQRTAALCVRVENLCDTLAGAMD